ncbi:protein kinase domain-containing protein [Hyalangium minutum]|uniref:Serine/threonine protein kinase PrkC, regulator of stationary phase n=1 Tax=Hyalangium minutum TaxID=394096 RepID=A0A085W2J1_9BACT|nr:protein kinase [Hyalangium minutum]KFE61904.1 Serine/threonine protein kinase PrkC, regulator of stationary phase [Hyalangium minutum]
MSSTQPEPGSQGAASPPLLHPYGQYVLVRKLAEGGMAEIFLAKLLGADGFERNVVIKRMLSNLSSIPDFVEMFRDEARLAARLSHPNIIQIHELGFIDGCYYICMEFLAGEDFSTTLRHAGKKRQYTPMPITLRVLVDAARGLHYAHDFTNEEGQPLHIVHRDISPSNLYVTYQGQVKVLDFGIAKAASRVVQTRTGVVKGKYIYMAPEQAQGKEVDRRADVFSLGVSLYESLTNVRPFARENDLAILNALLQGDFMPPAQLRKDIPPELEAVVLKAMAIKAEDRYATAADFADAIEHSVKGKVPLATHKELAEYLRMQFGEERFAAKTRIPTLASLTATAAQTVSQPPKPVVFASSGVFPSVAAPASQPPLRHSATGIVPPPAGAAQTAEGKPRRTGLLIGVVAGALLLLGGGGFAAWKGLSKSTPPEAVAMPAPPVTPPAGEPTPTPPAPAVVAAVAPAPTTPPEPATPEPETPSSENVKPPEETEDKPGTTQKDPVTKTGKPRPVTLGIQDVERVVARGRSRIVTCFEKYKQDLPSNSGVVRVQLAIASSGRVKATTQGPLASKPVGQCLETQAERLRFPAHRDREVNVVLPFDYTVTR